MKYKDFMIHLKQPECRENVFKSQDARHNWKRCLNSALIGITLNNFMICSPFCEAEFDAGRESGHLKESFESVLVPNMNISLPIYL